MIETVAETTAELTPFGTIKDCLLGNNGIFQFIGNKIMTLEVNGITILSWLIGIIIFAGILSLLVSLRPRIGLKSSRSSYTKLDK